MAAGEAGAEALAQRYEQLRAVMLDRRPGGVGLGLAVLSDRGTAAWMALWRDCPPPAAPIPAARQVDTPVSANDSSEIVRVLAAMALAHV
jgi:hypothetical protein